MWILVNLRWWKIHFERSGPKKNPVFGSTSSFLQLILRSFYCLKKLVQSTFGKKIKPSKRHPFSNIQWKVIALHLLFVIAWCWHSMSRKGGQSLILPNQFVYFMAHHSTAACNTSYVHHKNLYSGNSLNNPNFEAKTQVSGFGMLWGIFGGIVVTCTNQRHVIAFEGFPSHSVK